MIPRKLFIVLVSVLAFMLGTFAVPATATTGAEPFTLAPAVLTVPVEAQVCGNCHELTDTEKILAKNAPRLWTINPNDAPADIVFAPD